MKNLLLISTIILLISSCKGNLDLQNELNEELLKCESPKPLTAPKNLKFNELGNINIDNAVLDFQFIDNKIGYAFASQNFGGFVNMFKTEDGGNNWRNLNLKIEKSPINFHFLDKDNGFFSVYEFTAGCPDKCVGKSVLFITKNGGETWERKEYTNFKGLMYYLSSDTQKNLYAILAYQNQKTVLLKSTDKAVTWDTLYTSDNLSISSIKFGLKVFNDNIYAHASEGKILKISTKGELLKTIKTNQLDVYGLEIASKDTLLIKGHTGLHKSNDEGENWTVIDAKWGEIVEFISGHEGMVIKNVNQCPTDVSSTNDKFLYTTDGGKTWDESPEIRNLTLSYVTCQIIDNKYYLLINRKLYVFEKK